MRLVQNVFRADCWALRGDKDLGFPVRYPRKKQIGADRLANAAAARQLCGWPVVVVDFGTAVTFDVVDKTGAYCGGVIAPGLNAMTDYLHEKTALLPRIRVVAPRRAIGKSTREAMLTGAVIGYRGLVREIIAEIKKEMRLRGRLKVVATGGQARLVARGLSLIHKVNPLLTLEGVRIIALYQRVKNG
jgi:type III pantothenate kinase